MGGVESRSVLERASWVSMSFLRSVQVSMSWLTRRMMRRLSSAGVGRGASWGVLGSGSGLGLGSSEVGIAGCEVICVISGFLSCAFFHLSRVVLLMPVSWVQRAMLFPASVASRRSISCFFSSVYAMIFLFPVKLRG